MEQKAGIQRNKNAKRTAMSAIGERSPSRLPLSTLLVYALIPFPF